ncbi:plant UBX domain-containing protein 7-like [Papaver somniferum]|uniref:plant UBX domain-containing protein 7-like n=1 Tax=Papaver somniferum TaxID=3469 RepID=UPI000E7015B6|nr:plant UBX domain-containing protein 7-like [Papaver somniferum]
MESSNAGEQQSLISSFLDIAAGQSVETARKYLQATDWNLEQAIWLFYGDEEVSDPFKKVTLSDGTTNTTAAVSRNQRMETEKEEYLDSPSELRNSLNRFDDLKQWAYQNCFNDFEQMRVGFNDFKQRAYVNRVNDFQQRSYLNRFNDFEGNLNRLRCSDPRAFLKHMESERRPAVKVDNSENNSASMMHDQGPLLEQMYRPPLKLMYKGPLHDAKQAAEDEDKCLIVNVQSTKEFSSQTLNLNTWANETVSQTIGANFIFWKVYVDTPEGQKVCDYYNLKYFPAVLVLDPITRHMMRSWSGKIEPECLLEDLVPFMDASPKHHHAKFVTEESVTSSSSKKLTYPDLPEEPKVDEAETLICRIEVHFLNGRRLQRNFLRTDPIQCLWSFCSSQLEEAETRPFELTQAIAGASKTLDCESKQTFEESGLLDSMIYVTWD